MGAAQTQIILKTIFLDSEETDIPVKTCDWVLNSSNNLRMFEKIKYDITNFMLYIHNTCIILKLII